MFTLDPLFAALKADIHDIPAARRAEVLHTLTIPFHVTPDALYKWFQHGLPHNYGWDDISLLVSAIIEETGGAHTLAHLRKLIISGQESRSPLPSMQSIQSTRSPHSPQSTSSVSVQSLVSIRAAGIASSFASLLTNIAQSLADGVVTQSESQSLDDDIDAAQVRLEQLRSMIREASASHPSDHSSSKAPQS